MGGGGGGLCGRGNYGKGVGVSDCQGSKAGVDREGLSKMIMLKQFPPVVYLKSFHSPLPHPLENTVKMAIRL